MAGMVVVSGTKENVMEDIHGVCRRWGDNLEILIATGKDLRNVVIGQVSSLFTPQNLVLVIVDPDKGIVAELRGHIADFAKRANVLVYVTGDASEIHGLLGGDLVVPEKDREKRVQEAVRGVLRRYEKKMTHEAFGLLTARIRDESILEPELMKLVNFVGDRKEIKSRDIFAVVTETHEENMMTLFDAIAKRDKKEVVAIFENLMLNGVHVLAIHNYLVKQIRLLLQSKDMEGMFSGVPDYQTFAKAFSRWKEGLEIKPGDKRQYLPFQKPYYAFNLSKTSRRLGGQMLVSFLAMLAEFDLEVKSGTKYDRMRLECGLLKA
jgi:hypothetical protein